MSTDGLDELLALTELNLDDNQLLELHEGLSLLAQLRHLSVRNNKIGRLAATDSSKQSIPASIFTATQIDNLVLTGNPELTKAIVLEMKGASAFVERRRKSKDRALHGGALLELSIFGLD
jgi:hypothetical protein